MNRATSSAFTVVLSVLLSVAVVLLLRTSEVVAPATLASEPPPVLEDARVAALLARVDELERRAAERLEEPAPLRVSSVQAVEATVPAEPEEASWMPVFEGLEQRVRRLEGDGPEETPELTELERQQLAERSRLEAEQVRLDAAATLIDSNSTEEQKLAAHKSLRRVENAYTPEMVGNLISVGMSSSNAETRADVWRFFDGSSRVPAIVTPLIHALTDDDERVRREAAETLENYLGEPNVREALEHTAQRDASQRVRDRAQRSLRQLNR